MSKVICTHRYHPEEPHDETPDCVAPADPPEFCGKCGTRNELHLQGRNCPPWHFEKGKFMRDETKTYKDEDARPSDTEPASAQANDRQVGRGDYQGSGYQTEIQHWDFAAANKFDYFQGQITKYVTRWRQKNGVKDLEKAEHFLQKYLELARAGKV